MILFLKIFWEEQLCDKIAICQKKEGIRQFFLFLLRHETIAIKKEILPRNNLLRLKCDLNAYFVCFFVTILKNSENYRSAVTKNLFKLFNLNESSVLRVRIRLFNPSQHIIDYKWSDMLNDLCHERRELDSALAWLSTLGGAFSALGDNFEHCAVMAGRISVTQFRIALKLGDPQTISRCKLFYALSLIQRGRLKLARKIIENEHTKAIMIHKTDKRLRRMCCGIWVKLQYEWNKKYKRK